MAPRRNIEIKARVGSPERVRELAKAVATEHLGTVEQTDTFFPCASGRLKVREVAGRPAELIAYQRDDTPEAKASDYHLIEFTAGRPLTAALARALSVERIVRKTREVFLYHNVRIHLDDVEQLGSFVELESVITDDVDEQQAKVRLKELMTLLEIQDDDLVAVAYADLLSQRS